MGSGVKPPDGRSARWDEHRESRRAELVEAAVTAIDLHGPGAGIAEIAEQAGVSKPVLYRYFSDKDDLYRAVGHWGADRVLEAVEREAGPLGALSLPQVKFLQPLLPGEEARVELEPLAASPGARWRFRVLRGEALLASGDVAEAS